MLAELQIEEALASSLVLYPPSALATEIDFVWCHVDRDVKAEFGCGGAAGRTHGSTASFAGAATLLRSAVRDLHSDSEAISIVGSIQVLLWISNVAAAARHHMFFLSVRSSFSSFIYVYGF